MLISRIEAPKTLPISLSECKHDLRLTQDDQDAYLTSLMAAAVDVMDGHSGWLGHALVTQTWRMTMHRFPDCFRFPFAPVQSISRIAYRDSDNVEQTLTPADTYILASDSNMAWAERLNTVTFPQVYDRMDAVQVEFVAGYGDTGAHVPEGIKRGIRLLVAHWFENMTPVVVGSGLSVNDLPFSLEHILGTYRQNTCG